MKWLVENVRDGWDVDLNLGGAGERSFSVSRIDIVAEGMRVIVQERFAGTVEEYAAQNEERFYVHRREFARRDSPPPELWRFGVEYADGTRITTVDWEWLRRTRHSTTPEILMAPLWTSGHIRDNPKPYWFAPAPPPGVLRFALEWPMIGAPFASATINLEELGALPRTPVVRPPKQLQFRAN
jgi:hypothetical protein